MSDELDTTSYWTDTESIPGYPALDRDLDVDVVVVGAGLTGLTAAYLLQRSGKKVAVLERMRVGGVDSMATTAHVTCVTDTDLAELVKTFGRDHAQAVWDAGFAAIEQIEAIVNAEGIDCHWKRVSGVKHLPLAGESQRRREDASGGSAPGARARLRCRVRRSRRRSSTRPGVVFGGQARFHPRKYLRALAERINRHGSFVFEQTPCDEVVDEPLSVKARGRTITCKYIVLATHTPLMGKTNLASATLLQTKLYLYTSYVVGGRVAKGTVPDLLFWDTARSLPLPAPRRARRSRLRHLRRQRSQDRSGRGHRRAASSSSKRPPGARCRRSTSRIAGRARSSRRTTACRSSASHRPGSSPRPGYAGNGMTFGTLAGMMAHDACTGLKNPWQELFDLGRTKVRGGAWDYLKENVDYPYYMIRDRIVGPEGTSLRALHGRRRQDPRDQGRARRRLSQRRRQRDDGLAGVHAHGLSGRMESRGEDLGLPVPRLAVPAGRQGVVGTGRDAAGAVEAGRVSSSQAS